MLDLAMRSVIVPSLLLALAACAAPPVKPAEPPAGVSPTSPTAGPSPQAATPAPAALAAPPALAREAPTPAPARTARWQRLRPKRAVASSGPGEAAIDGDGRTEWNPRAFIGPGAPQWLAFELAGPAADRLAIAWHGHALHYVNYDYGRPRSYEIQVSEDSTDGADGTWRTLAAVHDNLVRSRAALIDAPGARWVRLRFTSAWSVYEREPFLREVQLLERRGDGGGDAWLIMGDSTTSVGMDPAQPDHLGEAVESRWPGHRPIPLSGGTGGDTSAHAAERLRVALPTLPPGSLVGLCYGSNDAKHGVDLETYRRGLRAAVAMIREAGHQPLVAVVPWSLNGRIADYARVCREVARSEGLPPGPDFLAHFKAHPEELEVDKVHPNAAGIRSMQRLWAEAGAFRYER